jgi:hypothetical protein
MRARREVTSAVAKRHQLRVKVPAGDGGRRRARFSAIGREVPIRTLDD